MRPFHTFYAIVLAGILVGPVLSDAFSQVETSHPHVSPKTLYFQCRFNEECESKTIEAALKLPSLMMAGDLNQLVELPAPLPPIRLLKYLPLAVFEQEIVPDQNAEGRPAVQISIDGPKLSYKRCLIAGNPVRDRMKSLIGTWRFMAVADDEQREVLYEQFENELKREPRLLVSRADGKGTVDLTAREGEPHTLDELGCTVQVRKFYPYYTRDNTTNQPINLSEERVNPAVLVEIEAGDRKEERWVFARFPDFDMDRTESLPFRIKLECPLEKDSTPNFVMVTVARSRTEVWMRHEGKITTRPLTVDERVGIPNSQYTFHMNRFVPSGRLVEGFRPTDDRKEAAVTALEIETVGEGASTTNRWLELGKEYKINTAKGQVTVRFGPRQAEITKGHGGQ